MGLEGAHSRRRILHVGDATGQAIMLALLREVTEQPNINLLTGHGSRPDHLPAPCPRPAGGLFVPSCHGAYVFDQQDACAHHPGWRHHPGDRRSGADLYQHQQPARARGDGLAMAYRAGARIANAEYIQFHPTVLHMPGVRKFLISEAVRGEGARLLTPDGQPFMQRYDPQWVDLAPRDVVARAIYWQMLDQGYPFMLLDIASYRSADNIKERFPQIYQYCLKHDIDITSRPIPVVPAAHYFCGGVLVDLWGNTTLPGLYAVGEVSCSGVHGANRLASTSLLEGLVWGDRAARHIQRSPRLRLPSEKDVPPWDLSELVYEADPSLIQGDMRTIRNLMWHYVGLIRSEYRLNRAIRELRHLWLEIEDFYRRASLTDGLVGLRNSVLVGLIIARAARHNKVSRGAHYREENFLEDKKAAPPDPGQV